MSKCSCSKANAIILSHGVASWCNMKLFSIWTVVQEEMLLKEFS